MMKHKNTKKRCSMRTRLLIFLLVFTMIPLSLVVEAKDGKESKIIVSLGDSYSSGEGLGAYYGEELPLEIRVKYFDWLAHRSKESWPGRLTLPSVNGSMSANRGGCIGERRFGNWYFAATSGAETKHMLQPYQKDYLKSTKGQLGEKSILSDHETLPPQLAIFSELKSEKADYVTLTLGGNDVGFRNIMESALSKPDFLDPNGFSQMLKKTFFDACASGGAIENLYTAYQDINKTAGPQAKIIVAGYPQLISEKIKIYYNVAKEINEFVSFFNFATEKLINICRKDNMPIYFVSVEDAFKDGGAYSSEEFIHGLIPLAQEDDISDLPPSFASFHPNLKGAQIYASCVQKQINILEKSPTLVGEVAGPEASSVSTAEPTPAPVISEEVLYRNYLRETLVPQYGIACDYELRGTMVTYQDEWLSASGIISAYIEDLDANQSKELCVFRLEEQETGTGSASILYTEVYGIEAGAVVLKDQIAPKSYASNGSPIAYGRNLGNDEQLYISSVKSTDDKFCFVFENRSVAKTFANGQCENFWTMQYVDGKLTYALALTQTAGGSSGFAYSGYVLENGEALSQETLGLEGDFDLAREGFFGKNGLAVKFKDRNGKSILANNSEAKLLLSINNTSLGPNPNDITYRREGETAYLFSFKITDYTELAKGLTADLDARYASYRHVVQDREKEYGFIGYAKGNDGGQYVYSTGLSFMQLRDLDRDGKEELILAYHTDASNENSPYMLEVWSYTGEKSELVFSTQPVHDGNGFNLVSIRLLNFQGRNYFFSRKGWDDNGMTISQMKDGNFVEQAVFAADYTDRNNPVYTMDGMEVSEEDYAAAKNQWFVCPETYPIGAWANQEHVTTNHTLTSVKLGLTAGADTEEEPEAQPKEVSFESFLEDQAYAQYTTGFDKTSLEYTITDLNADGISELLLQSTVERPFFTTWLFVMDGDKIELVDQRYGYGMFRYSPSMNAIEVSPVTKPMKGVGAAPFSRLEGTKLIPLFTLIDDMGVKFYSDDSGKKEITAEEMSNYFSDIIHFEWTLVP